MTNTDDEVLTLKEACAFLKISRQTMHVMLKDGRIKGQRIGGGEKGQGRWRFTKRSLLAFIDGEE